MAIWKAWKKHWASELDEQEYPGDDRRRSKDRRDRSGICPQPSFGHTTTSTLKAARASAIRRTLSQDFEGNDTKRTLKKRTSQDVDIFRTDSNGSWGDFFDNSGASSTSRKAAANEKDSERISSATTNNADLFIEHHKFPTPPPSHSPPARDTTSSLYSGGTRGNNTESLKKYPSKTFDDEEKDRFAWEREKIEREKRRQKDAARWSSEAAKRRAAHAAAKRRNAEEVERKRRSLELRKLRHRKKEQLTYADHIGVSAVDEHGNLPSRPQFEAEEISSEEMSSLAPLKSFSTKKSTKKTKSKRSARLWKNGQKVRLIELRRNVEYNGLVGVVEKFVAADGLYVVKLDDGQSIDSIAVRPANLCAYNEGEEEATMRARRDRKDKEDAMKKVKRRNRRWRPGVGYNDELEWLRAMALVTKTLDSRVYGSAHFIL